MFLFWRASATILLTFRSFTLWHHHVVNMGFMLLKKQTKPITSLRKWVANIRKRSKYSASSSTELQSLSFVWWNEAHSNNTNCCSAKPGRLAFLQGEQHISNGVLIFHYYLRISVYIVSSKINDCTLSAKEVLQSNSCNYIKLKRDKRGKAKGLLLESIEQNQKKSA